MAYGCRDFVGVLGLTRLAMTALVVIDMQCGMLDGDPAPQNVNSLVETINAVACAVRKGGGIVVFIQHRGMPGGGFAPGESGWALLPNLIVEGEDRVFAKTTCDSFYQTELQAFLSGHQVHELLIMGWATDFCVDTTIRAAASLEYELIVVSDGHTAADRPRLTSENVIAHHNDTWQNMLVPKGPIRVLASTEVCQNMERRAGDSQK